MLVARDEAYRFVSSSNKVKLAEPIHITDRYTHFISQTIRFQLQVAVGLPNQHITYHSVTLIDFAAARPIEANPSVFISSS
jgi:hypothetical protein